ncbi:T9SS type A sorting domain-containing protein [Psychroserpens sp.]
MKKITLLFFTLLAVTFGNEAYSQCTAFSGGGPFTDFNGTFGGAPCDDGTGCPFNEIDTFEAWADESYLMDNVILGNTYTFSLCNGPGAGTWPVSLTITAPSGNIDAFGTDAGSTCALTWTATEDGTYTIGLSEDGIPCDTSTNTATNNGYPAITCTDGSAPCPTFDCATYGLPYNENFDTGLAFDTCFTTEDVDGDTLDWISQQDLDLDGDMTFETFATNASGDATDVTNGGLKDDWFFSPAFLLTGGVEYGLSTSYNVLQGTAMGSLEAFILDGPSSTANVVATLFSNVGFTTQGDFATLETMAYLEADLFTPATSGDYYVAYRSFGARGSGFVLLFNSSMESTLSVDEFDANSFSYSYNKDTDLLRLESSNLPFDTIKMYSILGKEVISKELSNQNEVVDLSGLTDGVYLATVSINGSSKTIKILKQ